MFWPDYRLKLRGPLTADETELASEIVAPVWKLPTPREGSARRSWRWRFVTEGQLLAYAVIWLERELLNGGFAQYFWNPFSHFFADALRGLKALDLGAYLDLLERAGACFPGGRPSLTRRERMVFLEALAREMVREGRASADDETLTILNEGPFDQLNVRFYETYADGTEFYRAIAAYARGHPNEFWK